MLTCYNYHKPSTYCTVLFDVICTNLAIEGSLVVCAPKPLTSTVNALKTCPQFSLAT
jgi:hypothetical protein